jgi:hypothetical protein
LPNGGGMVASTEAARTERDVGEGGEDEELVGAQQVF